MRRQPLSSRHPQRSSANFPIWLSAFGGEPFRGRKNELTITALSIYKASEALFNGKDLDTGAELSTAGIGLVIIDALPIGHWIRIPLSRATKDLYRASARNIWDALSRSGRSGALEQIHHRIPLEWAHIFPKQNPNRSSNLALYPRDVHVQINKLWTTFKDKLGGRLPTQAEIMKQVIDIDKQFGAQAKHL